MGVYIKGMEMPETCEDCQFHCYHSHYEYVCVATPLFYPMNLANSKGIRKVWCPLVKLPKGEWLRMSDLSEKDDNRYKCSRCGNVIHRKSRMDLYTFNSWCGRCGSDNGRHTTIKEVDKWEEDTHTVIEAEGE